MIIISLTDCPPKLRGDLSKWLFEINTGVYVGRVSARVREEIWTRICENVKNGQATMVYPAACEQKLEFRVHNTSWDIVDYDGIKLMRRPSNIVHDLEVSEQITGVSKAAIRQKVCKINAKKSRINGDMTVIDIETTGLSHSKDYIIEIGALKIKDDNILDEFQTFIKIPISISPPITKMTGIKDSDLQEKGVELTIALKELIDFVQKDVILCHHAAFDLSFLKSSCKRASLPILNNQCIDTLVIARQKLKNLQSHTLESVAEYFSMDISCCHRAIKDCYLTYGIYKKLKEI